MINLKNNKMKKVFGLVLITLFTLSCNAQWGKKIKGNGKVVTIERSVGEYDEIAVAGWFDVDIVNGTEGELSLKGEENLLEYIKTEVKNGKLTIKVKKGYNLQSSNWKEGILVTVPVESVNSVMRRACECVLEWAARLKDEETVSGAKPAMVILVAHGDVLQILQSAFAKIDGRRHRSLPHLETAQLRHLSLAS